MTPVGLFRLSRAPSRSRCVPWRRLVRCFRRPTRGRPRRRPSWHLLRGSAPKGRASESPTVAWRAGGKSCAAGSRHRAAHGWPRSSCRPTVSSVAALAARPSRRVLRERRRPHGQAAARRGAASRASRSRGRHRCRGRAVGRGARRGVRVQSDARVASGRGRAAGGAPS